MSDTATATARALGGLLHDLNEIELFEMTASENRRALKEFLSLCRYKHCFWLRYDEPLDDMFQKEGLRPETAFAGETLLLVDRRQIKLATDFKPKDEVPIRGTVVLDNLRSFKNRRQLDATCLQKFYRQQELIPNSWKTKSGGVFFWGTIFVGHGGRRCVAYMKWINNEWVWGACYLEHDWFGYEQAAYIEE